MRLGHVLFLLPLLPGVLTHGRRPVGKAEQVPLIFHRHHVPGCHEKVKAVCAVLCERLHRLDVFEERRLVCRQVVPGLRALSLILLLAVRDPHVLDCRLDVIDVVLAFAAAVVHPSRLPE
uniref:Putative secreted protein n=1 Tax=Ixodes ricinus TaxID=34613 RepID=A0A6B0UNB6_IXORI